MRIKVDFSDFFDDERKLSVVNVNIRDFPTVQDVIDKIIRLFKLGLIPTKKLKKADVSLDSKPEYGLFEEGFYIHPEDTSTVLEDIGILKLKTLKSTETSEEKKKKKKRKSKEEEEDVVEIPRRGRKIKKEARDETQEEEEEGVGDDGKGIEEGKTGKRPKVQEEEDVRGQKKRRKKGSDKVDAEVCIEVVEDEVEVPKEIKRQTRRSLKLDIQDSESEVVKKSEKKHQRPTDSHGKEAKTLKKMKEEILSDDDSVTSTRDSPDLKRSQRFKKGKASAEDDPSPDRDKTEAREKESGNVKRRKLEEPSTENEEEKVSSAVSMRRSLRQMNEECIEEPHSSRNSKKILNQENSSQEKEVSTSFIGDNEKSESKSHDSELECESKGSESHGSSSYEADGPPLVHSKGDCSLPRKRRRRRHAKSKKNKPVYSYELAGSEIPVQPDSGTGVLSPGKMWKQKDVDIASSGSCTHVIFPSDDDDDSRDCEKKVTSASQTCEGNDIEVVQHISTPISSRIRSRRKCQTPSFVTGEVIDVEDDDSTQVEDDEIVEETPEEDLWRRYSLKESQVKLESLSALRQMAEKGAFTIVSVTSRNETVTSKTYELPEPTQTIRRDPPIPLQRELVISEETRKTFQKLLHLERCTQPLLLRQPRTSIPEVVDDSGKSMIEDKNQAEIPDQSTSASKQDTTTKIESVDSCELIRIPSTSLEMENDEMSQIDVPGPSKFTRRRVPRAYHAVGKLLSTLMKNKGEDGLQGITSNQGDTQCALERNQHEADDITSNNSNDDITSTMGDAANCEDTIPEEESSVVSDAEKGEDVTSVIKENVCLVEATEEEDSKKNILKDTKGAAIFSEESFLQFPLMKTRPKVGEYLAIKVLSLDETLRPIFSKYFPVQVLEVSGLKVKLKKVHNHKSKEACKKINEENGVEEVDLTFDEDDAVDLTDEEAVEVIELDWRDAAEPRLLFP